MKLTATQKEAPMTSSLLSSFDRARWYRARMRFEALRWRHWRLISFNLYADESLVAACALRDRALWHEPFNRPKTSNKQTL